MSDQGPAIVVPPPPPAPRGFNYRPDSRGWVILGFFALEFYMLRLISEDGTLLANAAFMQVMMAITTGGILLIASNLFGGTKSGQEMNARVGESLTALASKDVKTQ